MKILQVNCVYKKGSTGKIIYDIHSVLKEKCYESIICYGRGSKIIEPNVFKTSSELESKINAFWSRISGIQYAGCFFSTNKLIKIIKRENPDIVHLHCINGYFINIYRLLKYLKINKIHTILTLHAEFMYTGSCGYAFDCEKWKIGCGNCPQLWEAAKSYFFDRTHTAWRKMQNVLIDFDDIIITSVSGWLESRAKQSTFLKNKRFFVVENGIDTKNIFHPTPYNDIKKKLNITDEKVIVHVTASFSDRVNDIKGGRFIIELAKRLKNEKIKIIVIGCDNQNMSLPSNIINVGRTNNQKELAAYYSMADISIITSKKETFSMPCAESLACGTPVVGFKAGAPEIISIKEYSEFVDYGNLDSLIACVYKWLPIKNNLPVGIISKGAIIRYSKERMSENYMKIYGEIIND